MSDTQRTTTEDQKQVNWNQFNYPPLINLMHFRPSQIKEDRKTLVMLLFGVHIVVFINTILNIIENCILGGINILYAFLLFLMFNPIILFLFYRGYMGICKDKSKLSLYIYIQPLVIIFEIMISIVDFVGFNGFIKVSNLFSAGTGSKAVLALIISLIFLLVAVLSGIGILLSQATFIFQYGKNALFYQKHCYEQLCAKISPHLFVFLVYFSFYSLSWLFRL